MGISLAIFNLILDIAEGHIGHSLLSVLLVAYSSISLGAFVYVYSLHDSLLAHEFGFKQNRENLH